MTLEKLLNILLERGWRPRDREKTLHICCYDKCKGMNYQWVHLDGGFMNEDSKKFRELVSKESGLWQFVCKNKLFPKNRGHKLENDLGNGEIYYEDEWQYYVIESALCDEDKLEDFLLNNINIEG